MLFSGSLIGFQLLAFFTQNFPFIVPSLSPSHLSLLDVSPFVELGVVAGLFSSFRET
jgi:H+/Cl- antiporter ClcA